MGRGSTEVRRKRFYCSIQTQDAQKKLYPHFRIKTKDENGTLISEKDETELSGQFMKISHSSYVWEGVTIPTIQIWIFDQVADEEYKIETSMDTVIGRNLINRVINYTSLGFIVFRLYAKDNFAQLYMEMDQEPMGWKHDYNQVLKPLVVPYTDPKTKKELNDYTKCNDLLMEDWIKHEAIVNKQAAQAQHSGTPREKTLEEEIQDMPDYQPSHKSDGPKDDDPAPTEEDDNSGLPF